MWKYHNIFSQCPNEHSGCNSWSYCKISQWNIMNILGLAFAQDKFLNICLLGQRRCTLNIFIDISKLSSSKAESIYIITNSVHKSLLCLTFLTSTFCSQPQGSVTLGLGVCRQYSLDPPCQLGPCSARGRYCQGVREVGAGDACSGWSPSAAATHSQHGCRPLGCSDTSPAGPSEPTASSTVAPPPKSWLLVIPSLAFPLASPGRGSCFTQFLISGLLCHSLCAPSAFWRLGNQLPVTNPPGLRCQVWCVFLTGPWLTQHWQPNRWKILPGLHLNFSDNWDKLVNRASWPSAFMRSVYFLYPYFSWVFIYFLLIYKSFYFNPFWSPSGTVPGLPFVFSFSSWCLWSNRNNSISLFLLFLWLFHIIFTKSPQFKIIKIQFLFFQPLRIFFYVYNLNTFGAVLCHLIYIYPFRDYLSL